MKVYANSSRICPKKGKRNTFFDQNLLFLGKHVLDLKTVNLPPPFCIKICTQKTDSSLKGSGFARGDMENEEKANVVVFIDVLVCNSNICYVSL